MQDSDEILARPLGFPRFDLLLTQPSLAEGGGVRVQAHKDLFVPERVLLLHRCALGARAAFHRSDDGLHLGGIDQAADVGVGDHVGREEEILFQGGGRRRRAVDGVQGRERGRRPHDEASQVAPRGELEEVQSVYGAGLDAGDVAEPADQVLAVFVRVVHDQGPAALAVAATPEFALAGAQFPGSAGFFEVRARTDRGEELEGRGGFHEGGAVQGRGVDDQGDFGHGADLVAAGEEEGGNAGGGESGGRSEASVEEDVRWERLGEN